MASSCFPTKQKFGKNVAEICKSCNENNLRFKPHIHNLCVCVDIPSAAQKEIAICPRLQAGASLHAQS